MEGAVSHHVTYLRVGSRGHELLKKPEQIVFPSSFRLADQNHRSSDVQKPFEFPRVGLTCAYGLWRVVCSLFMRKGIVSV